MSIQRRRDEFRDLMQANDVVTNFVSEIYHRSGTPHLDFGKCPRRARLVRRADLL